MKETQIHQADQVQIVKQVNVKKKHFLKKRMLAGDGLTVFEFNTTNYELKKAVMKKEANVNLKGKGEIRNVVDMKEGCFYVMKLNAKNAVKYIMKEFNVPYVTVISE